MIISSSSLRVCDSSLLDGTPIAYEIVGGSPPRTIRGVVGVNDSEAELRLDPGVYEVRLFHPSAGTLSKVLDVSQHQQTVMFADMHHGGSASSVRISGDDLKEFAAPHGLSADSRILDPSRSDIGLETDTPRSNEVVPLEATIWRSGDDFEWQPVSATFGLPVSEGVLEFERPAPAAVMHVSHAGRAVSVCIPPGTVRIEFGRNRAGRISLRPRIANARAEAMLDYLMRGYVRAADSVRGSADAQELLDREHQSPAGAVIGAYYLLRTGEALEHPQWFAELANNFPGLPDTWVVFAQALLRIGGEQPLMRSDARRALLWALRAGLPWYREGVRLLREGLDWIAAGSEGKDEAVTDAIRALRPYQTALLHDGAVTCWECGTTPSPLVPTRRLRARAARA